MTGQTTPEPLTDDEIDAMRAGYAMARGMDARHLRQDTRDAIRLLDEVDRLRAQLDRATAAAAWERGQRRSQSSTLGVKIDQLGIARAEKAALAARLAEAEQARDEARAEATRQRHEREKYTERWSALDLQRLAALELHHVPFCEVCNDHGPCKTRRILDGDGVTACTGCGTCGACRAHEPATATGAPGPDPSEGTAPNGRTGGTQGSHEAPCLDSPAPLTLAQAATALHDWAGDLDDGANTAWPAGHADVIRGIRSAADWLDARAAYETEVRQRATEPEETPTLADAIAAAAIGGRRAANALAEAMATPSGHEPEEAHEEPPCIPVTVHTYGLTDTARNGLIDRVATAAHALDEDVSCTVGGTCPQCEPPEEAPEPTWRDVIRAMRAEGIHLRPLYDIADWPVDRTWQLIDHHGSELGIVTHETSYAGEEWTLALSYERGPSTRIGAEALQPADVLAAARLAGLIGDTDG